MSTIRTVNLLWERKYRGAYPPARYAIDDSGALTLAVPRPLEARTFDLTRLLPDGAAETRASFGVETLVKLDCSADAAGVIGLTSDDLYLFHSGAKARFMPDRRINYLDGAMSADGRYLAAAFSDIAGASFAVAFGEITGHVHWLREIPAPITAAAMARGGSHIAVGAENGTLWLLDASRREVWEFAQEGAGVRAIACSTDGLQVAYGLADGRVGLIGADGARMWEARLPGEVFGLALAGDAGLCAALCRPPENPGQAHIYCLDANGAVGWDFSAEKRLVSLSLSPNGRYLATGARDGTTSVYQIVAAEGAAAPERPQEDPLAISAARSAEGDFAGALRLLREAIDHNPADCAGCERLLIEHAATVREGLAAARKCLEQREFAPAIALLAGLLSEEPLDIEVARELRAARERRSEALISEAEARGAEGSAAHAERLLREAIAVAPLGPTPARALLAALHARQGEAADAEAERLLAAGDLHGGIAALERAQAAGASPARARRIALEQTRMEFATGMTAYNEKRYTEAVFQFKKVVARDPKHAEARRYLNFAQKFAQDAATESLNDRFARLE